MKQRRILIYGNAGAGKTTMARRLEDQHDLPNLLLDALAWSNEWAVRKPLADSIKALDFLSAHSQWVIEGCYGDLIEAAMPHCTELRFLNPGTNACVANCRNRPWEPDKYPSPEEQDQMLDDLIAWVRDYEQRNDEFSLSRHRAIFEKFKSSKREYK